jgi:hypothetical protein
MGEWEDCQPGKEGEIIETLYQKNKNNKVEHGGAHPIVPVSMYMEVEEHVGGWIN